MSPAAPVASDSMISRGTLAAFNMINEDGGQAARMAPRFRAVMLKAASAPLEIMLSEATGAAGDIAKTRTYQSNMFIEMSMATDL